MCHHGMNFTSCVLFNMSKNEGIHNRENLGFKIAFIDKVILSPRKAPTVDVQNRFNSGLGHEGDGVITSLSYVDYIEVLYNHSWFDGL